MASIISSDRIKADQETLVGIRTLGDYQPVNPAYGVEALTVQEQRMLHAREARLRIGKEFETALALEIELTNEFHRNATGARQSVKAQYGADSQAVETVGLTRASNRKRPKRRSKATKNDGAAS